MSNRNMQIGRRLCFAALCWILSCRIAVGGQGLQDHIQDPQGSGNTSASTQSPPATVPDQISAVPNRPTFSTTAESVQPGVFEVEYGFELADGHQNING